ncbi:hypothetical protein ATKI12_7362 [Kitasatospora sp. Ki12]
MPLHALHHLGGGGDLGAVLDQEAPAGTAGGGQLGRRGPSRTCTASGCAGTSGPAG